MDTTQNSMKQRGVGQGRPTQIACPTPDCSGVRYTLQPGEILGRTVQPGRKTLEKDCVCPECGNQSQLKVQVRASAS